MRIRKPSYWTSGPLLSFVLLALASSCSSSSSSQRDSSVATPDRPANDRPASDRSSPDQVATHDTVPPSDTWSPVPGKWVLIKAGSFTMGASSVESCRDPDDQKTVMETQHKVNLTHDFQMQTTEVTQEQFQTLRGYNPSENKECGSSCPVEKTTWYEAQAYCATLSKLINASPCFTCTGSQGDTVCEPVASYAKEKIYECPGFRLPTEAEWEYAYRAGTTTAFYNGEPTTCNEGELDTTADKIAWYRENSGYNLYPVGQKAPNSWGLYDMAGNVREWQHDLFIKDLGAAEVTDPWGDSTAEEHVLRNGSYFWPNGQLRAAWRWRFLPLANQGDIGFRCVRTVPKS